MSTAQPSPGDPRSELSAATDGDPAALQAACQAWRSSSEARSTWHTYHLIGDVMRSSELAQRPARDAAFLQALRERLASEPVVLAPPPAPTAAPATAAKPMQRWWVPAAAAAGFVAVAGVVVVMQRAAPGSAAAPQLAAAPAPSAPAAVAVAAPAAPVLIRDERLDEFLRAHQATRGGMGAALPGGAIRRVELEAPAPR
jgi:sigma-E factor negative regulatory protein RseA